MQQTNKRRIWVEWFTGGWHGWIVVSQPNLLHSVHALLQCVCNAWYCGWCSQDKGCGNKDRLEAATVLRYLSRLLLRDLATAAVLTVLLLALGFPCPQMHHMRPQLYSTCISSQPKKKLITTSDSVSAPDWQSGRGMRRIELRRGWECLRMFAAPVSLVPFLSITYQISLLLRCEMADWRSVLQYQ